jgi:hypothetical protein
MMPKNIWWRSITMVILGVSSGCSLAPVPPPSLPPSAPFFHATSEDTRQLAMWASELDTAALECASAETCPDDVHFARALVSLFENRDAARASFEHVMTFHPSSPLAAPSALWLQLLRDDGISAISTDPQRLILSELSAHWAREWIGRRLTASVRSEKKAALGTPVAMQAFQKQLQEKDRRIAELRFQLNALKLIDQDQADRHRKVRTPTTDTR